ncbi:MAG TPA: protein kinase, partial [Isosphaeraceae bacterium]|nr:protein kinase [Isosphaeraceae bacterium]
PEALAEQAVLLGLITQDQAREAQEESEDGSLDSLISVFVRKGLLTSWQVEKFKKADLHGFFFGGCKVLFHLAEGTFARVYRGSKMPGMQPVAIKVLRQRFVSDPGAVDRFNKEAEAGMRLVHPNIVRIYNYGEEEKRHYIVMEFVEGSNLRDFLKIRKRLAAAEALPMMVGLAKGLKHSLDQGVTHRDIKGTNILISSNGLAKLVDFGLATIDDEKRMAIAHGQRTVDYSALERTCGSPKGDPRSDIFFMGCVFYQMITGHQPLPEVEAKDPLAKMLKRSFGAIKPLSEQRYAPREELAKIIEKMMKMDLKLRYQALDEVVRDLEAFQAEAQKPVEVKSEKRARYVDPEFGAHDDIFMSTSKEAPPAAPPPSKNVLCVEVQSEIQGAFRSTLSKMGYRVLLVSDAERAAERYRESPADAVVFDADGLGEDAVDAFLDMHEKAHEDGHDLAAVVLLGHKQGELAEKLPADDRLVVLKKPIKMKDVQDALAQLVPLR